MPFVIQAASCTDIARSTYGLQAVAKIIGALGAHWPDLIRARGTRIIFAEVKAEGSTLSPEQRDVLGVLQQAVPVYTWRPSDIPAVLDALR